LRQYRHADGRYAPVGAGASPGRGGNPALHRFAGGRRPAAGAPGQPPIHLRRDVRPCDDRCAQVAQADPPRMSTHDGVAPFDYDVIVIGSGFGGGVTALRLIEKGYRVGVLEAGARFFDDDFAETSFDKKRFLFAPAFGWYGIQRIDILRDVLVLSGAGVGGGSLVYANTLYEPLDAFYRDTQWADITDWKAELAPYYDQARRMLGVTTYPHLTPSDEVVRDVAGEMGVEDTFHPTPVGVFMGTPGKAVDDPYFGGAGPVRRRCLNCGECMTGCRHN